jgi:protein-glutamine gamma-glutamyltransferase
MSAASAAAAPAPRVRPRAGELLLPPAVARGIGFFALASWGALHWMSLLQPAQPMRGWAVVAVGMLAMLALLYAGRRDGRRRAAIALGSLVPLVALALLAGGVPAELLKPARWGELTGGISRGVSDLPGIRVPYEGIDPWVRLVIPAGGSALVLIAALLAFWPRRGALGHPFAALLLLITLYVVPVVALSFTTEFLRGAVFTLLMVVFLRLEKLRMADAGAAGLLALMAIVIALFAAPALNRDEPWWNYEAWALETSASKSTAYSWDHTYGPLTWPRDGRELLRVKAAQPAYWKTENLNTFDGTRWLRSTTNDGGDALPTSDAIVARYTQVIRVSVRSLRSEQVITSGYASNVDLPGTDVTPTPDGLYLPARTLRRGDTYTATVYNPRPTTAQRESAGDDYPPVLDAFRTLTIPVAPAIVPGVFAVQLRFPAFGASGEPAIVDPPPAARGYDAASLLAGSAYGRVYALAQQLRRGARTPNDFIQNVLDYLGVNFSYSETPPRSADTLPGFLLDAKQGYCQQYSGAMALLLRMGGVPARVSTGFSSGLTDGKTGEYIVRDFDAHSWVEAYYPGWGWYTYDPTPADAPARSQPTDGGKPVPSGVSVPPNFGAGDAPKQRADARTPVADRAPWWRLPAFALAGLALLASVAAVVRRHRRGALPALSELERALRRTRRPPAPGTTLQALELRFAATPAAAGYVRALRDARYREVEARPTRAQRRGLRSELARGGGIAGRLRAWWALPPR